ncbi:hypothetical protein EN780_03350 [Mesorhizobium sp. M4B.F.Ca.ET.089.01.1.1]|uniref:hypothetical protein n=1 Tax=Mesorhizobium sp. M4B.F.Ca.ET.089.01.1.1 TaxID=2496662 RepID=UPI000FE30A36|nr:hypothetical protein [Mesorhizobium sp. M4B.F.Ca.ET.089.01.1.1]RWX70444.1 hypothetical protein EN780_03350 [Mesorhizobium sp. M4B.F.Ca.ET.089.01.1.1]
MPFNSDTYYANKAARIAYEWIAKAKDVKRRAAIGDAYPWEIERIPSMVKVARSEMRSSLFYRKLNDERKARKRNPK